MPATRSSPTRYPGRAHAARRVRLRLVLVVLSLSALAAVAGWVLLVSSLFGVATVTVSGSARVGAAPVVELAAIKAGTPLARLDDAGIARRVGRLPAVRTVQVRRDWPRAVRIIVQERVPAAVRAQGSGFVLVDRTGVAFDTVARRPQGLPLVTAPLGAGASALRAALDTLDAVPAPVRDQVTTVAATSSREISLRLTRGRTVVWGGTDRAARKGAVLAVLLSRKASVYDVSAPDVPTTRK